MFKTTIVSLFTIFTLIFTLGGCCNSQITHPQLAGPQLANQVSDETVALVTDFGSKFDNGHQAFCSAVWVGRKSILTANHCVEGYAHMLTNVERVKVLLANGVPGQMAITLVRRGLAEATPEELADAPDLLVQLHALLQTVPPVNPNDITVPFIVKSEVVDIGVPPTAFHNTRVIARIPNQDLALLEVQGFIPDHSIAALADVPPAVGSTIAVVGHPYHNFWMYRQGQVSAYRHNMTKDPAAEDDAEINKLQSPLMQIDANVQPGDSGGGVFDTHGDLVGINIFINENLQGGYCVHLDTIRAFLAGQHLAPLKLDVSQKNPQL